MHYRAGETDRASTVPFACVVPTTSTCLPLESELHEPRAYVVALVVMIVFPLTVNDKYGHRPTSVEIAPVVSTAVDGAGAGGGGLLVADEETTTVVEHVAVAPMLSLALHDTGVEPTGKRDPDVGEQLADTGATPPDTVTAKVTATGEPSVDVAVGTGQVIASGLLVGARPATSADGALRSPTLS
jgi:hypothetical protein